MCGICGVVDYRLKRRIDRAGLDGMLETIWHRGPDDDGSYVVENVGLGSRRLSIIDVAGGKQPITNEEGSVVLVFNGEIYNYRELREQLRSRGHTFGTQSDTEVIVHLYEESGEDCVHALRGMFSFALWDTKLRKLLLVRDRLGIKPLYYADPGGRLVFGSEIKAILADRAATVEPNFEALANYLALKYVPAPQTMFEGISALPPGHLLTCDESGVKIRRYWDLTFAEEPAARGEEEYAEALAELLRDSVRAHLVSDVPFGAFLSGGVDSSTVVALMSEVLDEPVKTFSVGFAGDGAQYSELPYARRVAERYETDHHEVVVEAYHLVDLAEKVVWHLDQPIADDACLANYLVSELASRHVKMVLTGEGGDELFGGYARHAGEQLSGVFGAVPRPVRALALRAAGRVPGLRRPKLALYALCQPDEISRLTNWFPLFNTDMRASLLGSAMRAHVADDSAHRVFAEHLEDLQTRDPLSRMLYLDTKLWLPDDLLARGDKMSMAASLEARVPLLDHHVVEFAATVPSRLKVNRLARKYLLKKVSRPLLPAEVIDRKKQGFPMPMSVWFRGPAREFARDLLSAETVGRRGLFEPAYVERLLREHDSGFADNGSLLWGLVSVELWHRLFIDTHQQAAAA
jgi:asparagine synthase (glutamine-hydrolysing)